MKIILDNVPLTEYFLPSRLLHRDTQVRELTNVLHGFERNERVNVLLIGPSGSGKTTIARWILDKYFKGMHCYVNCWLNRTSHSVLAEILSKLGVFFHRRESRAELLRRLATILDDKSYLVFLDEFDRLKSFDILYHLNSVGCSLILASTNSYALLKFSNRLLSRLTVSEIRFRRYFPSQIYDIVRDRARLSLREGSYSMRVLKLISYMSKGDARVAISLLRNLALNAEMHGRDRIDVSSLRLLYN